MKVNTGRGFPPQRWPGSDLSKSHIGRRNPLSTATQLAIPCGLSTHSFLGGNSETSASWSDVRNYWTSKFDDSSLDFHSTRPAGHIKGIHSGGSIGVPRTVSEYASLTSIGERGGVRPVRLKLLMKFVNARSLTSSLTSRISLVRHLFL